MKRRSTWTAPIALALVSLLGLVAGLLGDGPWDWACWVGLGLPVAACGWYGLRPGKATRRQGAPPLPTIGG